MKAAIIYYSQTGFTRQYAGWLAEETGGECIPLAEAKNRDFSAYDVIVFGSWCHAGMIRKLSWFKEKMPQWQEKKKIVFAVGATPEGSPEIAEALRKNFNDEEWAKVSVFYCPGGLRYENMKFGSKLMMKMFSNMMSKKENKSEDEKRMAEMITKSYDISDRKYILPVVECIQEL
ncbi:MAG: flavodoxin domain-containing protein [Lachnospiraceae bacterium]|nr:flavodoxin domain-containing protein [Lachnospiraceae bacterium]